MSRDAFVSYASPDRAAAMALVAGLESKGITCWIAPRDVPGGSKYAEVILRAITETRIFLLLFSEHSNSSEHVLREVERALHLSKPMMPVRLTDATPTGSMDYYLATLHWIDAFGDLRSEGFALVANAMAGILDKELLVADAPQVTTSTPEPGAPAVPVTIATDAPKIPGQKSRGRNSWIAGLTVVTLAVLGFGLVKFTRTAPQPEITTTESTETANDSPSPEIEPDIDPAALEAQAFADSIHSAIAAAGEAWRSGDRKNALLEWAPVFNSPEGKITLDIMPDESVTLMREMLVAAAEDAESDTDVDFETIEAWRPLITFSEIHDTDASTGERKRFASGWLVRNALHLWTTGERVGAARAISSIAENDPALLLALQDSGNTQGRLLRDLLEEIVDAASEGHLGTLDALTREWAKALQLAADAGNVRATAVLASLAWEAKDFPSTASLISDFKSASSTDQPVEPVIAGLLGKVIREANSQNPGVLTRAWEPAYELAVAYGLPGSTEQLAELMHSRDPGQAAPLFRQLFEQMESDSTLRRRVGFCLDMLKRYDIGDESVFYRERLQEAFESTLAVMDQQRTGGQLIEELPEITDAAAAGIPAAQYILGDLHMEGKGVEKDPHKAFDYYSKAANGGFAKAKYAMGECLRDGRGTLKNVEEALRIWRSFSDEEAAEVPQVLFNLAQLTPPGVQQDQLYEQARKHYETKIAAGEVARYGSGLGQMLVDGKGGESDPKSGFQLLEESAELGSSHGAFLAGFLLENDDNYFVDKRTKAGVTRDVERGTKLIKRAALNGYPNAIQWCTEKGIKYQD